MIEYHTPENGSAGAEKIMSAALNFSGRIYTGLTHVDAVKNFLRDPSLTQAEREVGLAAEMTADFAGFLTTTGRFVDQEEAFRIARGANQLKAGWQPRLYPQDVEKYAQPDPGVISDRGTEARAKSPLQRGNILRVVEAMESYL